MGVVILDDEWIEKQVEVPQEYRRYIRREDISKLPKGLKIYRGLRGGLFYDVREYERITGEKPTIGSKKPIGMEKPSEELHEDEALYNLAFKVSVGMYKSIFRNLKKRIESPRIF